MCRAPRPPKMFLVFVFPLPLATFRPLGRPLTESSKTFGPVSPLGRCRSQPLARCLRSLNCVNCAQWQGGGAGTMTALDAAYMAAPAAAVAAFPEMRLARCILEQRPVREQRSGCSHPIVKVTWMHRRRSQLPRISTCRDTLSARAKQGVRVQIESDSLQNECASLKTGRVAAQFSNRQMPVCRLSCPVCRLDQCADALVVRASVLQTGRLSLQTERSTNCLARASHSLQTEADPGLSLQTVSG
jgi:hypothetical protein